MNRCALCPGDHNCVGPSGPPDADVALIGEGPGHDEDKKGIPFCGKTGEEVNRHYLPLGGLRRENIYATNTFKCMPKGVKGRMDINRTSDLALMECCAGTHLYPELNCNNYKLLLPVGAFACRALDPDIDLELQHGFPVKTAYGQAFPMYHPAQGIHEPKKMLIIRNDWIRLGKWRRGELTIPVDEFAGDELYTEITHPDEVHLALDEMEDSPLACDTETAKGGDPYCLTFSVQAGTGFLIRAENLAALSVFQSYLDRWRGPILFHNWLYDFRIVKKMDLRFPSKKIKDTMAIAFHIGNIPQGLKALAYRLLGMKMQDFYDLVAPYSYHHVVDYYHQALLEQWPKPEVQLVRTDDGGWKEYKPHSLNTKLKIFFTYLTKNPNKDVFEAWDNWESEHSMVEERLGPWPGLDIRHVPFDKILHYACRDADATIRLYEVEKKMLSKVRKTGQENWLD